MEDTENYLNSILEKRLGSIPAYGGFSKNGNNVTRLPKREEKIESMPTVFRLKQESTIRATGVMPSERESKNPLISAYVPKEPLSKKLDPGQNERVEYVTISKRLSSHKEEITTPTVDISKYRQTAYVPPEEISHNPKEFSNEYRSQNNRHLSPTNPISIYHTKENREIGSESNLGERKSQVSQTRSRKSIFSQEKRKVNS